MLEVLYVQLEKKWRNKSHLMEQSNKKCMVTMATMDHISKSQLAPSNKVFGRHMLTHTLHTPDIVLANYYLFRLLSNYLRDRAFGKVTTIKDHLSDFYSP
jgi:hypothetical protein